MDLKYRYLLIFVCIIIFGILTPVLILGIRGYVYDFQSRALVKTGLITVRTEPRQATITVSGHGQEKSATTPANMRFIRPGDYNITVEREGYHLWQKRLTVRGGLVTWVHTRGAITLLLQEPRLLSSSQTYRPPSIREEINFIYDFEQDDDTGHWHLISTNARNVNDRQVLVSGIPERHPREVYAAPNGLIFVILDKDLYQVNNNGLQLVSTGVNYYYWDRSVDKLIYGNDFELNFYNPFDPSLDQNELIVRSREPGGDFCVLAEAGYLLRVYEQSLRAIELDGRDHRNMYELLQFEQEPRIIECDSRGRKVIIKEGNLYKTYRLY